MRFYEYQSGDYRVVVLESCCSLWTVGKGKEISVARYLVMPGGSTTVDVMAVIAEMPGTKKRSVGSIRKIDHLEYLEGLRAEKENFFLQRLFDGRQAQ